MQHQNEPSNHIKDKFKAKDNYTVEKKKLTQRLSKGIILLLKI